MDDGTRAGPIPRMLGRVTQDLTTLDTRLPFTRAAAIAAGIPARAFRGDRFRQLLRGVYVDRDVPVTPRIRALAALALVAPSAFASHVSAARVYGVPVPALADEHVSVVDPAHRRVREGVRCHVRPEPQVRVVAGVRVSAPEQMFAELASLLTLVDLVIVGDHLVRQKRSTCQALVAACSQLPGAAGRHARRAAALVRARVDSPMETRLRLLIVLAGIPEPEVNLTLRNELGDPIRSYDLSWPSVRVIVEYDGRHHVERVEQWERDLERREQIDDDDWRILVVISNGIFADPGATVDAGVPATAAAGASRAAGRAQRGVAPALSRPRGLTRVETVHDARLRPARSASRRPNRAWCTIVTGAPD